MRYSAKDYLNWCKERWINQDSTIQVMYERHSTFINKAMDISSKPLQNDVVHISHAGSKIENYVIEAKAIEDKIARCEKQIFNERNEVIEQIFQLNDGKCVTVLYEYIIKSTPVKTISEQMNISKRTVCRLLNQAYREFEEAHSNLMTKTSYEIAGLFDKDSHRRLIYKYTNDLKKRKVNDLWSGKVS